MLLLFPSHDVERALSNLDRVGSAHDTKLGLRHFVGRQADAFRQQRSVGRRGALWRHHISTPQRGTGDAARSARAVRAPSPFSTIPVRLSLGPPMGATKGKLPGLRGVGPWVRFFWDRPLCGVFRRRPGRARVGSPAGGARAQGRRRSAAACPCSGRCSSAWPSRRPRGRRLELGCGFGRPSLHAPPGDARLGSGAFDPPARVQVDPKHRSQVDPTLTSTSNPNRTRSAPYMTHIDSISTPTSTTLRPQIDPVSAP